MVVGLALAAVQMGMALPTGFLFGVGYGTGVRVGYEQVYPLLFPKGARPTTTELAATMKGMNTVYDAIGGKDASRMGIAVGITNAGEILNNPDFRVLEQLESSSSGLTSSSSSRSRFGLDQESAQQAVSSEIDKFNQRSGANWYIKFRAFSITQINNWLSGTGHDPLGHSIALIVLQEKLSSGGGQSTKVKTPSQPSAFTPPPSSSPKKPVASNKISIRTTAFFPTKVNVPSTGQVRKYLTTLMKKNSPAFRILSFNIYASTKKPGRAFISHTWIIQNVKLVKQFAQFVFVIPVGY